MLKLWSYFLNPKWRCASQFVHSWDPPYRKFKPDLGWTSRACGFWSCSRAPREQDGLTTQGDTSLSPLMKRAGLYSHCHCCWCYFSLAEEALSLRVLPPSHSWGQKGRSCLFPIKGVDARVSQNQQKQKLIPEIFQLCALAAGRRTGPADLGIHTSP